MTVFSETIPPQPKSLQVLRQLMAAETPGEYLQAFIDAMGVSEEGDPSNDIQSVEIYAFGLGRWTWGVGGVPLIDADLQYNERQLGSLRISGREDSPMGELVGELGPLIVSAITRLLVIQEAEHRATIDALTGLLNRAGLERRLAEEMERSRRNGSTLSLLMVDVDDLKNLNDEQGHQGGDRALSRLADVLRALTRGSDLVARFGGDEFMILLPETDQAAASLVAARIRKRLKETNGAPKVSIGLSEANQGDSGEQLIRRADRAMYQVKEAGRDGVSAA